MNDLYIGITGLARSGKDTFGEITYNILQQNEYECKKYSFANQLKSEVADFLKTQWNNNLPGMRSFIYKQVKSCTNFNITMGLYILQLFKPKIYVDISSGWGDRLVMAIAYSYLERNKTAFC